jgi:hypothetical protein
MGKNMRGNFRLAIAKIIRWLGLVYLFATICFLVFAAIWIEEWNPVPQALSGFDTGEFDDLFVVMMFVPGFALLFASYKLAPEMATLKQLIHALQDPE